jgi:hypothetical protein
MFLGSAGVPGTFGGVTFLRKITTNGTNGERMKREKVKGKNERAKLVGAGNKELIGVVKGSYSLANWALPLFQMKNEKWKIADKDILNFYLLIC